MKFFASLLLAIAAMFATSASAYDLVDAERCVSQPDVAHEQLRYNYANRRFVNADCVDEAIATASKKDSYNCPDSDAHIWLARRFQDIDGLRGREWLVGVVAINATAQVCEVWGD